MNPDTLAKPDARLRQWHKARRDAKLRRHYRQDKRDRAPVSPQPLTTSPR